MNPESPITVENLLAAGYISSPPLSIHVHNASYSLRQRNSHTPLHEIHHYEATFYHGRPVNESFCITIFIDDRCRYQRDYLIDFADLQNALHCGQALTALTHNRLNTPLKPKPASLALRDFLQIKTQAKLK